MNALSLILEIALILGIFLVPTVFAIECLAALFSSKQRKRIREWRGLYLLWGGASFFFVAVIYAPGGHPLNKALRTKTETLMSNIKVGLAAYETEYTGALQKGGNAYVANILCADAPSSENPRRIAFLMVMPSDRDSQGEILDAWKTPLFIDLTDPHHPGIYSAGPDGKWGTADDISSDVEP